MRYSVVLASLILLFGATPNGPGAVAQDDCGDEAKGRFTTCVDEIFEIQGDILDNIGGIVEGLAANGALSRERAGSLNDRIERLKGKHGRGKEESLDVEEDDFVTATDQGYQKSCGWTDSFAEPPDGTCDKQDRKDGLCEKVCELGPGDPEKADRKRDRLHEELTDVRDALDEVNGELEGQLARLAAFDFEATLKGDTCPADYSFLGAQRVLSEPVFGLQMLAEFLDGSRDVAERLCDQTVAGTNWVALICPPLEVAFHLTKTTYNVLDQINTYVNEAELAAAYACVKLAKSDTTAIAGKVLELEQKIKEIGGGENGNGEDGGLAGLQSRLEALEGQMKLISDYLLLPPGRRPGYSAAP